jgi:phosphate transport system protein
MSLHFEQELEDLKEMLLRMAGHAETAVVNAVKAVTDRDDALARRVEAEDSILDHFEVEVDEVSIELLAKAPLASDLRLITVAMKISHDLERVGDEATTIARRARELNQEPPLKPYVDLPRMADLALAMLKDALSGFVARDAAKARVIIPRDKEVDGLNKQLHRELVSFMVEKPGNISRCLNLMVVSKSLERIADHATNIAEEVVYLCEACDIRHNPEVKRAKKPAPPEAPPAAPAAG